MRRCGRQATNKQSDGQGHRGRTGVTGDVVGVSASSPNTNGRTLWATITTPHQANAGRNQPPRPSRGGADRR